jgi:hypothetical protein
LIIWGFSESSLTVMAASIPMMRHLFKSFRRDNDVPATATTTSATVTIGTARCNPLGANHFTMSDSTAGSHGWRLAATNSGHDDVDANTKSGTAERRNWSQQQASQLQSIEKPPPVDGGY